MPPVQPHVLTVAGFAVILGRMKKSVKASLLVVALTLLAGVAGLVWLGLRAGDRRDLVVSGGADNQGTSFEVQVERPRMDRFLGGILPTRIEAKLLGNELRFDHASRGANAGSIEPGRLELSAEGWDLLIEVDAEGKIAPATRLVFPMEMAEVQLSLRCRPAEQAVGFFRTTTRAGASEIVGDFVIELARCENAATGKTIDTEGGGNPGQAWPSDPLTLRGRFAGPAPRLESNGDLQTLKPLFSC